MSAPLPLLLLLALQAPPSQASPPPLLQDEQESAPAEPEILWIPGTLDEVRELSRQSGQLILVEVETGWCETCGQMEERTLGRQEVVDATLGFLCKRLDAESPAGIDFCREYRVGVYPTYLVLDPDGTVRDRFSGFFPSETFVAELDRITRNENTLASNRARVKADPTDLDARLALARKLRATGDLQAAGVEIETIRTSDPSCASLACRILRFEDTRAEAERTRKPELLYALLEGEQDATILHDTWMSLVRLEGALGRSKLRTDAAEAALHYGRFFVATRLAWRFAAESIRPAVAESLAWELYREREHLPSEALELGLRLGERAVGADRENTSALEVLGRLNLAAGRFEEANLVFRLAMTLQPGNAEFRRLAAQARRELRQPDASDKEDPR